MGEIHQYHPHRVCILNTVALISVSQLSFLFYRSSTPPLQFIFGLFDTPRTFKRLSQILLERYVPSLDSCTHVLARSHEIQDHDDNIEITRRQQKRNIQEKNVKNKKKKRANAYWTKRPSLVHTYEDIYNA